VPVGLFLKNPSHTNEMIFKPGAADERDAYRCVWFTDLRYDLPALPDTFRYGHCQTPPGAPWRLFRLRYFTVDGLEPLRRSSSATP